MGRRDPVSPFPRAEQTPADGAPPEGPRLRWHTLDAEVRGLLLLTIRTKGFLPHTTASALNVISKPEVVHRYKLRGNRWTEPAGPLRRQDAVPGSVGAAEDESAPLLDEDTLEILQAAKDDFGDDFKQRSTAEWLQALAVVFDGPVVVRPWYASGASGWSGEGQGLGQRGGGEIVSLLIARPHAMRRLVPGRGRGHPLLALLPRLHLEARA